MIFKAFKYKGVPIKILSPTLAADEYEEILNDERQGDVITIFMEFDINQAHYECGSIECENCPFQPYEDCEIGIFQELLPVMKLTKPRT